MTHMASSRRGSRRPWRVFAGLPLLLTLSCSWVLDNCGSSRAIVQELNNGPVLGPPPTIAEETREYLHKALTDSYWSFWVESTSFPFTATTGAGPVSRALGCLFGIPDNPTLGAVEHEACFSILEAELGLSPAPSYGALGTPRGPSDFDWQREQDSVRFQVVLREALTGLTAYLRASQPTAVLYRAGAPVDPLLPAQLDAGVRAGLEDFIDYQSRRAVRRSRTHRPSGVALSGGAANGAYSAGAVWWLLHELDRCKAAGGCRDDSIDMASGTSTGCLIAAVISDYFVHRPAARQTALGLLTDSYLCTTASDLYCLVPVGASGLGVSNRNGRATGLVRFRKLMKMIEENATEETLQSPVELIASTVDFRSGRLYHLSTRDRLDLPDPQALRFAIMGSVAEPFVAEPIYAIGRLHGLFMDGGVRSGLPVTPILLGGIEAALSFINEPPEPRILAEPPQNGLQIVGRTIELFSHQPIEGELEQAELRLAYRRELEDERCRARLASNAAPAAVHDAYCANESWPGKPASAGFAAPSEPLRPRSLGQLYRSARFFEPNVIDSRSQLRLPPLVAQLTPGATTAQFSAPGYAFDPKSMWNIFVLGAAQAQERCAEVKEVLGWGIHCDGDPAFVSTLQALHGQLTAKGCYQKSLDYESCPTGNRPISMPELVEGPQAAIVK